MKSARQARTNTSTQIATVWRTANHKKRGHIKLNRLNLTVSNVPEAHRFLEKHFGLKGYNGTEPRESMSFLSDGNGTLVALFRGSKGADPKYPAGFHIRFIQAAKKR